MMCPTIDETIRTGEEMRSASWDTPSVKENGASLRQNVYQDLVQILSVPCAYVPKIHLWI